MPRPAETTKRALSPAPVVPRTYQMRGESRSKVRTDGGGRPALPGAVASRPSVEKDGDLAGQSPPPQLTVRALAIGCAIGAALAAGNTYTGLKSSFIDGGALTAALLSFTFFATFKRLVRVPFGPLENNIAQTAASSAAIMAFVHGLMGPMPAMMLMGHRQPPWALWVWGLALSVIGIVMGTLLRRKLVVEERLPFPSGIATAELIRTAHADEESARRSTRF